MTDIIHLRRPDLTFSREEWEHMLDAYVAGRHDDLLYMRCLAQNIAEARVARSRGQESWVDEDAYGFLPDAIAALGRAGFRRAMKPFAKQMQVYVERRHMRGECDFDIAAFRAALRDFERWCDFEDDEDPNFFSVQKITWFGWEDEAMEGDMAIFDGNPAHPVLYIMLELHDCDHPNVSLPDPEWASRPYAEKPCDTCAAPRLPPPRACP